MPNLGPSKYGPARFSVPRFEALIRALREVLIDELEFDVDDDSPASRQDAFRFTPVDPALLDRILDVVCFREAKSLAVKGRFSALSAEVIPFKKFLVYSDPPGQNSAR